MLDAGECCVTKTGFLQISQMKCKFPLKKLDI